MQILKNMENKLTSRAECHDFLSHNFKSIKAMTMQNVAFAVRKLDDDVI